MRIHNILKTVSVLLGASVVMTGCIKETFPYEGVTTQDQTSTQTMVNAIPTIMISNVVGFGPHMDFGYGGVMGAYDHLCGEALSLAGNMPGGSPYYDQWYYFHFPIMTAGMAPAGGGSAFFWSSYYTYIKEANALIAVSPKEGVDVNRGIAKAFRALFYLDMARMYDPLPAKSPESGSYTAALEEVQELTVPIIDENNVETDPAPRATREEIFNFILADLNDAEACLDGYVPDRKNLPSQAVVYGLKARTYLWLGGFDKSYETIPTGAEAYELAAEYARKAIDTSGCSIMSENEWVSKTSGFNTVNNSWMWAMIQSSGTVLNNLYSWSAHMSVEAIYGYGYLVQLGIPVASYNRLSNSDFRKRVFVDENSTYKNYESITTLTKEEFASVAPYTSLKFKTAGGEKNFPMTGNVTSIPLMRVEEMYLIEAEATAQRNSLVGEQLLKSFMAHRDPKYVVPTTADLIDEIIFQKRIELWGEGLVIFDMKRLNIGIKNGSTGTNAPMGSRYNTDGRAPFWNFCIYLNEVQQNTALTGKNNPDPSNTIESNDYI